MATIVRVRGRRTPLALAGTLLLAAALTACGASAAREDGATDAGLRFAQAVTAGEYRTACELLAPETRDQLAEDEKRPCAAALGEVELPDAGPARSVEVYGRQALLRTAADTLFLSQFGEGWRVTAAGCVAEGGEDEPYRCELKGA